MLRGIVALLVCLYHLTEGFFPDGHVLKFIFSRGYLGVEIFFVISGFVIPYTMWKSNYVHQDAGTFMLRRLARIEPPYWCSIALIFLSDYISTFFRFYKDKVIEFNWRDLLYHVLHLNDFLDKPWLRGIYWSLAIEVQFYTLMAIVFPYLIFRNKIVSYLLLFAFCMGRWLNWDHTVFYYGCHFVFGLLLFNAFIEKISVKELWCGVLITFGLTYWCFDWYHLSAVFFGVLFINYFDFFIKPLVFLGKISYSFYLIHIQIGWLVLDALLREYPQGNKVEFLIYSVAAAILGSYIFYLIIEKPSHRLARSIGKRE
jgi:peptidoglycan/LPS O-acetylase OafA/YrhL